MVWSGAFPIMIGMAAIAFAANSLCKNTDKRTSAYQVAVAVIFVGVLCAFLGIVMMGSGMGLSLFGIGPPMRGGGMGMGMGGYGGGYY
jgi:hypothetical protein